METELKDRPEFVGVNSDFDRVTPSAEVHIDCDRAAARRHAHANRECDGLCLCGEQVSLILASSDQYPVMLELLPSYQSNISAFRELYITSKAARWSRSAR